eukprot:TRINITY_DN1045_c0_g1_i1.p1 TRINITY_DN1045_c0_g1~~TRINITY_DN1045_c0_g1_i1.p1  ORF type:complete len:171 (+),score=60.05 TRINITY_DN1045_c0_g1_i1:26-514(+)
MYSGGQQQIPLVAIKSVFQKYDKDNSGTIGRYEFKNLCYELGYFMSDDEVKTALDMIDKDGTGHLSLDEFVSFWRDSDKFKKLDEAQSERLKASVAYFRYFDPDNSGNISSGEYPSLHADLIKNSLLASSATVDQGLARLDKNKDGKISFNEFMAYMDEVQQ